MTSFQLLEAGWVYRKTAADQPIAVCPRWVFASDGSLVCSFMLQSKIGSNDMYPVLARSTDAGATWSAPEKVWPALQQTEALFVSIGSLSDGRLTLYGSSYDIDEPGESFWSEQTQGLKQNRLVWAHSQDDGRTWTQPLVIPMQIPGSAEEPAPLWQTRTGRLLAPYAPYNTFDPKVTVDRNQVALLYSDDDDSNWRQTTAIRLDDQTSMAAEAWVVELSDGRLLATAWHVNTRTDATPYPNAYAISHDAGTTWSHARSTGIMAHTTCLCPLKEGRALFGTVRRDPDRPVGIYLSVAKPTDEDFGLQHDQLVFDVARSTQNDTRAAHDNWQSFSFGEPSFKLLDDGTILGMFWQVDGENTGIRWMKIKAEI